MIVRELITLLGFKLNKQSYDSAKRAYDQIQGGLTGQNKAARGADAALTRAGQAAAQAGKQAQQAAQQTNMLGQALGMAQRFGAQLGISALLKQYVTLASDANETRGALTALFGQENIGEIDRWSKAQGAAMGRSEYDLQAYAARLGSVLGPVTKSREEAQAMAQSLSQVAVDLGSFFNTSDESAMMALRSGLTGEYESLKRYGVVINDVTLQEVARARGIKKKVTAMTVAEKTELRYQAILDRTKASQGDAVRTGQGFANASKALEAQLKDLGIGMAMTVIPRLEKIVRWARDAVTKFNKMAKGTKVLESAMYTLGAVAGILALEFYGAFVVPAIAIGALILLVDELWTTFEGGDTLIKDWLDGWFGVGTTSDLVAALKESLADINTELAGLDARGVWETFAAGADNAGFAVERLIEKLMRLAGWLNPIEAATRLLRKGGVLGQEDATDRAMGRGMDAPVAESISEELALRQRDQQANIAGGVANRAKARAERERERKYGPSTYRAAPDTSTAWTPLGATVFDNAGNPVAGDTPGAAAPPVQQNTTNNFVVNGGDPAAVKRVVDKALEDDRKKRMAAVGRRGGS
jgi:hypothetical protein